MLKKSVPINWTTPASQSILLGSHVKKRIFSFNKKPLGVWRAFIVSMYWEKAAVVKKIEPTKKVIPSI
jgi:hypothetical protein